ncbi:MAG TPA: BON domain-containing protein [Terriglobales bacterium]|nr:BON domain-containing protein [Terriglobales bacterium]
MTRILFLVFFLSVARLVFTQQQPATGGGQNPPSGAPSQTQQPPSTIPQQQQQPMANSDVQSQIQNALGNDPSLSGANVQASVDDQNITVSGNVQSETQKQRVLALIAPYQAQRKVVDKITVK